MDIIPVLDIMKGQVVQGHRGDRQHYRPVESILVEGAAPLPVAAALIRETGCSALYIADLDALEGTGSARAVLSDLRRELDVDLWVDAGVSDADGAGRLLEEGAARVVVGTETLRNLGALREIISVLPPAQVLVSLDVGRAGVLSSCLELRGLDAMEALAILRHAGVTQVLFLTLDRVGTGEGPAFAELRTAMAAFAGLSFIAGGGVHTPVELAALRDLGVDGTLVATALHRGWIGAADIDGL
jgi:phosphoribosylformimino-5-aminoimidazole carboxamide ribotide isomerase